MDRVMLPVLCATGVPGGSPAGIASLNFCRFRIATISASDDRRRPPCRAAMLLEQHQQPARRRRVVQPLVERLLILDAAQHLHAVGAERVTVRRMLSTPSFSISRFAAKLLLTVIIGSQSCRSVIVLPTAA